MSARQLAGRMGVMPPRITELEKAESQGNITLKTLKRAAEALDCDLYYSILPKTNLEDSLRRQAERAAKSDLDNVSHTMRLEEQGPTAKAEAAQAAELVEEWIRNPPRRLWDRR